MTTGPAFTCLHCNTTEQAATTEAAITFARAHRDHCPADRAQTPPGVLHAMLAGAETELACLRVEIERLRAELAMAPAAAPTLTQHDDGTVTMAWPDTDPPYALVAREVLAEVVERINGAPADVHRLTTACQQLTTDLEQARADRLDGEQRVDWGVMADPERYSDGGRVWPCDDEQEARGWAASRPGGGLHVVRRRSVVGPWEQINADGTVTVLSMPAPRREG